MKSTEDRPEGSEPGLSARERSDRRWMGEQRDLIQEALLEGEERLQALLDDAMAAVYLKDLRGRYLTANRWAEIMFRLTRKEAVGKTDHDLFPKEVADALRANDSKALEAEAPIQFEQFFLHEDGEYTYQATKFSLHDSAGNPYAICGIATDITKLKQAEEALHESEEWFRSLVQNASDTFMILGGDGTMRYQSPSVERVLGYGPQELIGKNAFDYIHPEDAERVFDEFSRVTENPEDTLAPVEYRFRHADGSWRYLETVGSNQLDDPSIGGIVTNSRDVTERKRAEEALKESEERFRSLIQNSSDVITIVDAEGVIFYQSPSMEGVLGHDPEERIGDNAVESDLIHPEDQAAKSEAVSEAVRNPGTSVTTEVRMRHRDGSWRYIEDTVRSLLDDPSVGGIVFNARDVTERKEAEARLRESEERFRSAFEDAPIGVALVDLDRRRYLRANRALCEMLGYSEEELLAKTSPEITHPEDLEASAARTRRVLEEGAGSSILEKRYIHADGHTVWTLSSISLIQDSEGKPSHFVAQYQDITERKRAEERLKDSEERYRAVIEQSAESIFLFDAETNRVLESNTASQELLGYTYEELLGMIIYDFLAHDPEDIDASVERDLREKRRFVGERQYRLKDGSLADVDISMSVIPYRGGEALCMVARDITERKALEDQLRHRAFHDTLTELPNRALFLDRLQHALDRSDRIGGPVAVLFVDLDDFKVVNDSLGHDAGNALLVGVAGRLRESVRPGDTVARLFGDEFAIVLEAPTGVEDASRITERITEHLRVPFELDGEEVCVTSSVGIAVSDAVGEHPEELLRQADLAMYAAKSRDKARYEVFTPSMSARASERLRLENELRRAVERKEFEVYYQPIVELGSGKIDGVEALVRWRHPERGLLAPSEFLLLAEETGLMRPIGQWVLEEACQQACEWRAQRLADPPLMSVNFSMERFGHQPDLISKVLDATGLDPGGLQLEITERAMVNGNVKFLLGELGKLKDLGVRFAIDDYGVGYSWLYHLKRMPVDLLKIDRSFIAELGEDPEDTAIVSGMIGLAHALGLKVVAEGVGTAYQLAKLDELGCDLVQGFYLGEPLPNEAMSALLAGKQ